MNWQKDQILSILLGVAIVASVFWITVSSVSDETVTNDRITTAPVASPQHELLPTSTYDPYNPLLSPSRYIVTDDDRPGTQFLWQSPRGSLEFTVPSGTLLKPFPLPPHLYSRSETEFKLGACYFFQIDFAPSVDEYLDAQRQGGNDIDNTVIGDHAVYAARATGKSPRGNGGIYAVVFKKSGIRVRSFPPADSELASCPFLPAMQVDRELRELVSSIRFDG